jgi:hypothetical protein
MKRPGLIVVATSLLAAPIVLAIGAQAYAQARGATVELSAQQHSDKPLGGQPKSAPKVQHAPQPHVQRVNPQPHVQRVNPQPHVVKQPTVVHKSTTTVITKKPVITDHKVTGPIPGHGTVTTNHRVVVPTGPKVVVAPRMRGLPSSGTHATMIHGHNYSAWRGDHRVRYHGGWRTFVGLSALGAIAIAGSSYYPYAYISAPQPYCDGWTEDGCQLVWQDVQTVEGDVISQCVAYCPWQ